MYKVALENIIKAIDKDYPLLPAAASDEHTKNRRAIISDIQLRLAEIYYMVDRELFFLEAKDSNYGPADIARPISSLLKCIFTKFKTPFMTEKDKNSIRALCKTIASEAHSLDFWLDLSLETLQHGITIPDLYEDKRDCFARTSLPGCYPGTINSTSAQMTGRLAMINEKREKLDKEGKMTKDCILFESADSEKATEILNEFKRVTFNSSTPDEKSKHDESTAHRSDEVDDGVSFFKPKKGVKLF